MAAASSNGEEIQRFARIAALLAATLLATSAAWAQQYPNRPIRVVVPYAAGGTSDILARQIGPKIGESLGQPMIVENKPGASGNVGADFVAKCAPTRLSRSQRSCETGPRAGPKS